MVGVRKEQRGYFSKNLVLAKKTSKSIDALSNLNAVEFIKNPKNWYKAQLGTCRL